MPFQYSKRTKKVHYIGGHIEWLCIFWYLQIEKKEKNILRLGLYPSKLSHLWTKTCFVNILWIPKHFINFLTIQKEIIKDGRLLNMKNCEENSVQINLYIPNFNNICTKVLFFDILRVSWKFINLAHFWLKKSKMADIYL